MLSRNHPSHNAIAVLDAALLISCLIAVGIFLVADTLTLDVTMATVVLSSGLLSACAVFWPISALPGQEPSEALGSWARSMGPVLRIGLLEWAIFAGVSVASLAVMQALGGPDVVAGIRLGETLSSPIGILASALPLISAASLRSQDPHLNRWPKQMSSVFAVLTVVSVLWIAFVLAAPPVVISLLVGDHADIARSALLGLALGVFASIFAASSTLFMKHRGQTRELGWLRWGQLAIALPFVSLGSLSGNAFGGALGVSAYQTLTSIVQFFLQRRQLGPPRAKGSSGQEY